ncbi:uncharacterized protein BKA55DRAFT_591966 [Fusarium redolens]|uniref:NB-ARC domain-containing protein n=1 Tax=Fusarium redolens TaxID=48865 RepID=A0A9P9HMM1_FUSRE|nr:uncharacterized protein BKA55DRAFT_591966 [Fusarium redolens]KAH7259194.1 hypothetical protein BKA55DRAFT_591966 [Fusarium redolens]
MAFGQEQVNRIALVGLGGVGKTQIALQFAYQTKEKLPHYLIFWIPTLSDEGAERAYMEIARKLGVHKANDDYDVKELVCQHLASGKAGKWLLIVDNADDPDLILGNEGNPGFERNLPLSDNGVVLITTRTRQIAVDLAHNKELVLNLLAKLTFLPLAITQASAYLNQNKAPIRTYLKLQEGAETEVSKVLGKEFRDNTRYRGTRNAIGTTWIVSFNQIQKSAPLAVNLLSFISHIEPKAIPQSMLPGAAPVESASAKSRDYSWDVIPSERLLEDAYAHVQRVNDAIEILEHVVDVQKGLDEEDPVRLQAEHGLAAANLANGQIEEAIDALEHIVAVRERTLQATHTDCLGSRMLLGAAFLESGQTENAMELFESLKSTSMEILGENDFIRLSNEHHLGVAYSRLGRIEDAIPILEHVVESRRSILLAEHSWRLASEFDLANIYWHAGRIEEAIEILEHVVSIEADILMEDDSRRRVSKRLLQDCHESIQEVVD